MCAMDFINEFLIILVMIILNAFFSAYVKWSLALYFAHQTHLFGPNQGQWCRGSFIYERPYGSKRLAVVQLGVTSLVGSEESRRHIKYGGAGVTEALNPYFQKSLGLIKRNGRIFRSLVTLIIPLSSFTIIFAELIPKIFAIKNSEWVILKLSKIMVYFSYIANPVVSTMENIVKGAIKFIDKKKPFNNSKTDTQSSLHELTAALAIARTSRLIDAQQEKIVLSAAQLSLRPIKDITIPVADICMIPKTSTLSDALVLAHLDMHTRFPVCENIHDPQTIVGYINFKDIIAALKINPDDPTIKGTIRPIMKFVDSTPISKVLERMIQEKLHISLVENTQKQVIGMITQEDIIEELVGEIEDEFDRLPNHIHPYGNQWLVGGAVTMSALAKTMGLGWTEISGNEEDLKLADWCQRHSSKPFNGGEIITGNGFQITVRKLRRKKISEAFIAKA